MSAKRNDDDDILQYDDDSNAASGDGGGSISRMRADAADENNPCPDIMPEFITIDNGVEPDTEEASIDDEGTGRLKAGSTDKTHQDWLG